MRKLPQFRLILFLCTLTLVAIYPVTRAGEIIPDIEAHQFDSTPLQKSKTGRIYLFKSEPKDLPQGGSIILIHDHDKPAMAFRVLRTDETRSEYIGKKIRRYDSTGELNLNEKYFSLEKIADIVPGPPATDQTTFNAAEKDKNFDPALDAPNRAHPIPLNVEKFDQELDQGTDTQRPHSRGSLNEPLDDYIEETATEIEETHYINPYIHTLGIGAGYFRNMSQFSVGTGETYGGLMLNYSKTLSRDLFVFEKSTQDGIDVEFNLAHYSRVDENNDTFDVLPFGAQLRYDLHFSNGLTLLTYFGFQYNYIMSESMATPDQTKIDEIQGFQQTLGIGVTFNLGPHWYLRTDLGWDKIAASLALKW